MELQCLPAILFFYFIVIESLSIIALILMLACLSYDSLLYLLTYLVIYMDNCGVIVIACPYTMIYTGYTHTYIYAYICNEGL